MNTLLIEGSELGLAILVLLLIVFGVPLLLIILGIVLRNKRKKTSKVLLISAVVYVLIGLGFCGVLMI